MKESGEEKRIIPPYISFKTVANFADRLKVGIPHRIDKSLMGSLSGGAQSQLLAALRYLGLMNADGIPTEKLHKLVNAEGDARKQALNEILKEAYPFLFKAEFDLKKMTFRQLQECFEQHGTSGDTTRKCMAFLMSAAKEAGIGLSPHLKIQAPRVGRKPKKAGNGEKQHESGRPTPVSGGPEEKGETEQQTLLSKFPSFDPAWPDDVKSKWFDGFKDLMEIMKNK